VNTGEENVPPKILGQSKAIYCFVVNQLATPGLGSIIAKRTVVGTGQLILALVGFFMIMSWMFKYFFSMAQTQIGEPAPENSSGSMGKWGLIFFGASWAWALVTSISLIRQARNEFAGQQQVPPPIAPK